jgi:septal ring factor EnvC (AmiA/AmiB activator)
MENFCLETAESIAQMANAATADRAVLTQITDTNTSLLAQIKGKDKEIANLRRQLNNKTTNMDTSSADTVPAGNGARRILRDQLGKEQNTDPLKKRFNTNNYCHSHGYDCHEAHTSATCKFPKPNHKNEATWENNMDGSQNNKAKV